MKVNSFYFLSTWHNSQHIVNTLHAFLLSSHNNRFYPHFGDEQMKACRDQTVCPAFSLSHLCLGLFPKGDKMANITISRQTRGFSQTTPNGFGTWNKRNTISRPFFLQEKSLLLDRTSCGNLAKVMRPEAWEMSRQQDLNWGGSEGCSTGHPGSPSSTLPRLRTQHWRGLGELVPFLRSTTPDFCPCWWNWRCQGRVWNTSLWVRG